MSKYHPIDVRYKGRSTAYTGSLNKRRLDQPAPTPRAADLPRAADKPKQAPANPWGSDQAKTPAKRPQQSVAPARKQNKAMPLAWHLLVPWPLQIVFGFFRRLGWAWSIALLYILGTVLF